MRTLIIFIIFFVMPSSTFAADKVLGQWKQKVGYYIVNVFKIIEKDRQYKLSVTYSFKGKTEKPFFKSLKKVNRNGRPSYRSSTGDYFTILPNGDLELRDAYGASIAKKYQ